MDIAIVTGAETPIGTRISERLLRQGCRVHGMGNNFSQVSLGDPGFVAHAVDLTDLEAVQEACSEILRTEGALHILVHAVDVTPGAAFEKLPVGNLEAVLKIGLLGPVLITRLALPNLLRFRGQIIHLVSANKSGHPPSAANALIEGGVREMHRALFDRARAAGVRVTNLILRQNESEPVGNAAGLKEQTGIDPAEVARTLDWLLAAGGGNVPAELVLHPRLSAEATEAQPKEALPVDPYEQVFLPPKEHFPPEQPKIPTKEREQVERTIPYTDEEMEDRIAAAIEEYETQISSDREADGKPSRRGEDSRRDGRDRTSGDSRETRAQKPEKAESGTPSGGQSASPSSEKSRSRRSRRRKGRGRDRQGRDEKRAENRSGEEGAGPAPHRETGPAASAQGSDAGGAAARENRENRKAGEAGEDRKARETETAGAGNPEPASGEGGSTGGRGGSGGPQAAADSGGGGSGDAGSGRGGSADGGSGRGEKETTASAAGSSAAPAPGEHAGQSRPEDAEKESVQERPTRKKAAKKAASGTRKSTATKKAAATGPAKKTARKKAAKKSPANKAAKKTATTKTTRTAATKTAATKKKATKAAAAQKRAPDEAGSPGDAS